MTRNPPPQETIEHVKGLLAADVADRQRRAQAHRAQFTAIEERERGVLLGHLRPQEAELKALMTEKRELLDASSKRNQQRRHATTKPPVAFDTHHSRGLTFKARPYDFAWTSNSGQGDEAADPNAGTYRLAVQSFGDGHRSVAAGIGFWFFSADVNPLQRFSAYCDYFDDWWDLAGGYAAHNDGRTRLWIFGQSENAWVGRSDQTPSWSDGVGWFESHGNNGGGGEDGTVSNEVLFIAARESWYQCWIWSSALVYGDGGAFGFGASSIQMNVSVPFAVVGGL